MTIAVGTAVAVDEGIAVAVEMAVEEGSGVGGSVVGVKTAVSVAVAVNGAAITAVGKAGCWATGSAQPSKKIAIRKKPQP